MNFEFESINNFLQKKTPKELEFYLFDKLT